MILQCYVVKDDLSGYYQYFGNYVNEAVARRAFNEAINAAGVPTTDLMLYHNGSFDSNTGVFVGFNDPVFIMRGEKTNA